MGSVRVPSTARNEGDYEDKDWPDFACGAGASVINIICTFPAYKVMFRQQIEALKLNKAVKQLLREGIPNIYRGVIPPLLQRGTSLSIMFGAYHKFQRILSRSFPSTGTGVVNASAAMLAGTAEAMLTPFERVQILLSHRDYNEKFSNTAHAFKVIRTQYCFKEYYRGLTPILMRNGPSNVLFFGLRGRIKEVLPEAKTQVGNTVNDFLSGAVLGACLSTLFYPVNVAKNHMQKQLGGEFTGFFRTLQIVYTVRGRRVRNMYYGLPLNFSRALVSWGIINCSYELLKKLIIVVRT
ncbi:mitochondrial nicotinamide adenine dinucleotide transporter SLC25A51 [Nematostella vectensis]|uniref:mitochondrial nicotinamide adenine dinucleotide transporter SLC25A51 n=1 Tax=Nematostella vectensis TaxID=45351 RepID=UPI0020777E97|nr:mitochondrial nicotinamide adenine dinucleotide transporter SLC25A51 [Nematostella vectensis]